MEFFRINYYRNRDHIIYLISKEQIKCVQWDIGALRLKIFWANECLQGYTQTCFCMKSFAQGAETHIWETPQEAVKEEILHDNAKEAQKIREVEKLLKERNQ